MNFMAIPLFSAMKAKLGHASARQAVLAQNVANADTPGYRAKDIAAPDFKSMANRAAGALPMQTTNAMHMTGGANGGRMHVAEKRPSTYELNPNGNNVVIEEEMMRVAENQAAYQQTIGLYRKTIDMFKAAVGRPGGG